MTKTKIYLKAKLLEKPFVLPYLVSLLKLDLGLPPGLALQSWVPEHILVDNSLVQGDIHRVPGLTVQRQDQLGIPGRQLIP